MLTLLLLLPLASRSRCRSRCLAEGHRADRAPLSTAWVDEAREGAHGWRGKEREEATTRGSTGRRVTSTVATTSRSWSFGSRAERRGQRKALLCSNAGAEDGRHTMC